MPCRDDYGPDTSEVDNLNKINKGLRDKLDLATRVACELEKVLLKTLLEPDDGFNVLSAEAKEWITKHREKDRKEAERVAREARIEAKRKEAEAQTKTRKNAALAKLTPQERRELGLPEP